MEGMPSKIEAELEWVDSLPDHPPPAILRARVLNHTFERHLVDLDGCSIIGGDDVGDERVFTVTGRDEGFDSAHETRPIGRVRTPDPQCLRNVSTEVRRDAWTAAAVLQHGGCTRDVMTMRVGGV